MQSRSNNALPFGFRIVGACQNDRRPIDWLSAFVAHCDCDDRAEVDCESYLSAFCFANDFVELLTRTGSPRGFAGECWAGWLWFDIDRDDVEPARADAGKLAGSLVEIFELAGDELLIFFSGSKGFHIGLPLAVCNWPQPSIDFHLTCRKFAEQVATVATVAIDSGVYDRVRAFRSPNSRHPKTGLHKRILTLDELFRLSAGKIRELANDPVPFDLPSEPAPNNRAVRQWESAQAEVEAAKRAAVDRISTGARLNRSTVEFMREGATTGDRHRRLFSAAANLAEFGCSFDLAFALLSEPALDTGLPPADVRRQIECGLNHRGLT